MQTAWAYKQCYQQWEVCDIFQVIVCVMSILRVSFLHLTSVRMRLSALFWQGARQDSKLMTYKSDHEEKSWLKKFAEASTLQDSKKVVYGEWGEGAKGALCNSAADENS